MSNVNLRFAVEAFLHQSYVGLDLTSLEPVNLLVIFVRLVKSVQLLVYKNQMLIVIMVNFAWLELEQPLQNVWKALSVTIQIIQGKVHRGSSFPIFKYFSSFQQKYFIDLYFFWSAKQ